MMARKVLRLSDRTCLASHLPLPQFLLSGKWCLCISRMFEQGPDQLWHHDTERGVGVIRSLTCFLL